MREAFISILALMAVAVPTKCSEIGKDGFNFYKDYLRGRSDDIGDEGTLEDRVIYFYRTPLIQYPSLLPTLEQEYKKRTGNAFKNHMLSKEMFDGVQQKRSSKTALSFMMQGKPPYFAPITPKYRCGRCYKPGANGQLVLRNLYSYLDECRSCMKVGLVLTASSGWCI